MKEHELSTASDPLMPGWERPARIPASVPLLHADPPYAVAGRAGAWRLEFRLAADVPAAAGLKLQLLHKRNNLTRFRNPQVDRPGRAGYIRAETAGGQPLALRPDEDPDTFDIAVPDGGLREGQTVIVWLGEGEGIEPEPIRTLNKFFLLYSPDGAGLRPTIPAGQRQIVAACSMHVLGGPVHHLRAYVPSQTTPGETFTMLVRPEDEFSNLSCESLDDAAVYAGDERLVGRIEPVSESTCARIRLQLPEEGVYRLRVRDARRGIEAAANPTVCKTGECAARLAAPDEKAYWGMIHGHTEMSDGQGTLEYYFGQMRDEAALDFAASADHDHLEETSDAMWQDICRTVAEQNRPGTFVTFLGYEWAKWRLNGDGDRNVYYLRDHRPICRSGDGHYPSPPDLFDALADETAIIIPHHTAHGGNFCDFKDHDPLHERLIEIYQWRGSYETTAEGGNHLIDCYRYEPAPVGYVARALAMGWRVGFTAGGDDHFGHSGTDFPAPATGRKAGLMCVRADALSREAIWDALWNRRVVATTGARMLLDFQLNGRAMGSELNLSTEPALTRIRRVHVTYHGTCGIERIDIIRNNVVVHSERPGGLDCEMTWEDTATLDEVLIGPAEFCDHRFCFYYVRVIQTDGEAAWASPVWIDA